VSWPQEGHARDKLSPKNLVFSGKHGDSFVFYTDSYAKPPKSGRPQFFVEACRQASSDEFSRSASPPQLSIQNKKQSTPSLRRNAHLFGEGQ
jgi:hypothetical protein